MEGEEEKCIKIGCGFPMKKGLFERDYKAQFAVRPKCKNWLFCPANRFDRKNCSVVKLRFSFYIKCVCKIDIKKISFVQKYVDNYGTLSDLEKLCFKRAPCRKNICVLILRKIIAQIRASLLLI